MSRPEWQDRCHALAEELRAACAETLGQTDLRLKDQTATMWLEEEDPQVIPHHPIGLIYRYHLREHRVHRLFGRRWLPIRRSRKLVAFGLEEMFESLHWTRNQGLWCVVSDGRLVEAAYRIIKKFGQTHRIEIDFAPRFF